MNPNRQPSINALHPTVRDKATAAFVGRNGWWISKKQHKAENTAVACNALALTHTVR